MAPRALRDADEILVAIVRDAPPSAERWLAGLNRAVASLSLFPHRCPFAHEERRLRIGLRTFVHGSYRILFTIDEELCSVNVLRVRHGARDAVTAPELEDPDISSTS